MSKNEPNLKEQRSWGVILATGILILSVVFVVATFYLLSRYAQYEQEWISLATDIQVTSQQLAKSAGEAGTRKPDAFLELANASSTIDLSLNKLRTGTISTGLPIAPTSLETPLSQLKQTWIRMGANTKRILDLEQQILDSPSDLFEVRGAADEIYLDSRDMFEEAVNLKDTIARLPQLRQWPSQESGAIGIGIMVVVVWILVYSFLSAERRRAKFAAKQNKKNQQAILKLLDEMSSLADGDLTVQATVTEEITGAIADAVNFTIEQLRELVKKIKFTAQEVAGSALETRKSTSELANAAALQAKQVGVATTKVKQMAQTFDSMAKMSGESSDAASHSLEIAHKGGAKVRETISGMDTIREQIQQTSKRIKRLGESTQEIGDIVNLINGIAEQTNVLALNSAIQAASAGGAGKGFAVVADEVQQLAESATVATRRIESLVQTIQTDTAEAVVSMEATTSEVVSGAYLAEDAGIALEQIELRSKELSGMIDSISQEAHNQSATATEISELMKEVQSISVQASQGSTQAASSVENLAELVMQLRDSVTDFKLPEDD